MINDQNLKKVLLNIIKNLFFIKEKYKKIYKTISLTKDLFDGKLYFFFFLSIDEKLGIYVKPNYQMQ